MNNQNSMKRVSETSRASKYLNFADLRLDSERQIEKEAYTSVSLGPEVDELVAELIEIGRFHDFVSDPGGAFDDHGLHVKARGIGRQLNKMGGMKLMRAVWYRVVSILGPGRGRALEIAWGHIGDWLP